MLRSLEKSFDRYRRLGDVAALGRVFDRVAPELMAIACRLTRSVDEAEDVVQATFVAAIESAGRWDGTRPLAPWLTGILGNQVRMHRRAAARARAEHPPREDSTDPAEEATRSELRVRVGSALESLPRRYREVVRLSLVEGLSSVELGRRLGLEPSTVRTQLSRGLELLRRRLPAGLAGALVLSTGTRGLAAIRRDVLTHASSNSVVSTAPVGASIVGGKFMILALIVVVGSALPFLWPEPDPVDPAPAARREPARAAIAPPGAAGQPASPTASTREAAPSPTRSADHLVRIVDENGEPVPGAELRTIAARAPAVASRWGAGRATLGELIDELGPRWIADENGQVVLPDAEARFADVRAGARRAFVDWTQQSEWPVVVTVRPTASIPVQVSTLSGSPDGIALELYRTAFGSFLPTPLKHRAVAPASGAAVLEGIDAQLLDEHRRNGSLAVGFAFPLAEPPLAMIDGDDPSRELRLEAPELASLEIALNDPLGKPVGGLLSVGVSPRQHPGTIFWRTTRSGTVSFPHVGVGLELRIQVVGESGRWSPVDSIHAGPSAAGELGRVEVVLQSTGRRIQGRAMVAAGQPHQGTLYARVRDPRDLRILATETGEDGRFELQLPAGVDVVISAASGWEDWSMVAPAAAFEESEGDREVILGPPPILVAGRCVNARGQGVAEVVVSASERARGAQLSWSSTTAADGRFEIRGWSGTEELVLETLPGRSGGSGRTGGRVGDLDVELILIEPVRSPRFEGRLPAEQPLPPLQVAFVDGDQKLSGSVAEDGGYSVQLPESGVFDFVVLLPGFETELVRVPGVAVSGHRCEDPRIAAVDVISVLRSIDLEVVDAAGQPIRSVGVSVRDGDSERCFAWLAEGSGVIWVPEAPHTLIVHAEGRRDRSLATDASTSRLVLEEAIELPLRLSTPFALEAGESLQVQVDSSRLGRRSVLRPQGAARGPGAAREMRRQLTRVHPVDASGQAEALASAPGAQFVRVLLVREQGRRRSSTLVGDVARVEVVDGRNERRTLAITQAQLDAARAALD